MPKKPKRNEDKRSALKAKESKNSVQDEKTPVEKIKLNKNNNKNRKSK